MSKRIRRQFTPDFKAGAVALVLEQGQPVSRVCRDLDLVESVFRRWIEKAQAGSGAPSRSTPAVPLTAEQAEIQQLRRENEILRMEREILKKATAFFAKESS
jgi:transposase-like protein